jgi:hypothetical protein
VREVTAVAVEGVFELAPAGELALTWSPDDARG